MGRIIYRFSIYMFYLRGGFPEEKKILKSIRELLPFIVTTYIEPWFTATTPAIAPKTDVNILKNIMAYSTISKTISKKELAHFSDYLWYLSPLCVPLAFFDKNVSDTEKLHMVANLSVDKIASKKAKFNGDKSVRLADFVNAHSKGFFEILGIDPSFLDSPPSEWPGNPAFQYGLEIVESLHVVNDVAERAVNLTGQYNCQLTKSETSFQDLLLVMHKTLQEDTPQSLTLGQYSLKSEK
ncbi:hypothetical protein FOCC_FOCC007458 [Frankliniella occidentalis]|nr:hypothetical protein FOCC_FOCC007458 [Frankliniella occidentalis]